MTPRIPQKAISRRMSATLPKVKTKDGTKYLHIIYRVTGILMTDRFKTLYTIYSFIYNFTTIVMVPLMFTLSYFMVSEKFQINQFLNSVPIYISVFVCEIKFAFIICMKGHLFDTESIFDKLDARIQNPEEIRMAQKAIRFGNNVTIVFAIVYFISSAVLFLGGIYVKRPVLGLYIPYLDWRESSFSLYLTDVIEYILLNIVILQEMINDTYAVIYIGILRMHLKILIMRLLRIGTDRNCSQDDNKKELVRCICAHKNVIKAMDTVGLVISTTYFVQLIATTACLGSVLINISISDDNSILIISILCAVCLLMEIFPISYLVNTVTDEGDRLPEAIFHMNWIDQNLEFRRLCLFFMQRSQRKICFYAGKLFEINMDTFVSIIKCSFSIYTLLSTMELTERFN